MRQNMATPCSVRKHPETFCCTLIMRRSRSAWLLSKGTAKSCRNRSTAHFPPESRSSRLRAGLCLGLVGESIGRADVDPPPRFAHTQSCFILVDHFRLHQSRFEAGFHLGQLLMTGGDKGGNTACRELDSQQLLQQLACASIGHALTFHQIRSQCLDARPILRWGLHRSWKVGSCQMKAPGTLLFFHTMFRDPEPFGWQVHHLTPFWHVCCLGAQVVLAALTAFNGMDEDVIRLLHLLGMMPTVSDLSAGLLAAFFPQALGWPHKAIIRGL